ncbi:MAG: penicillin-binding protein 2 [Alphaproteobacteria bacterium]|nr:penicillin-binding protein 2 [Alphaproteobacteria bacterium]
MAKEKNVITKRSVIFTFIEVFLCILILARLVFLQIYQTEKYKLLSDKNRISTQIVLPNRGNFIDIKGRALAINKLSYSAVLNLKESETEKLSNIIDILKSNFQITDSVLQILHEENYKIGNAKKHILIKENLNWTELSRFYLLQYKISGLHIDKSESRHYLYPKEFSHILGYISTPTQKDVEESENKALLIPTAKVGKTGLEKVYNDDLFGKVGITNIEVNAKRQFVRDIEKIEPTKGNDIKLTIDIDLQKNVYEILSSQHSASCVVLDVNTGAILAYVSVPGYDTNIFTKKIASNVLKEIYDDPYKPLINKCISGLYAPGSAFKMITAIAALRKGVINQNTRFHCNGCLELGRHKFHCWRWKYGGHGFLNVREALAQSCDVFFYNLAKLLKPEEISEVANDFGLGVISGIDLPGERSGLIPTKKWKKERYKQSWTTGDTFNMSIGQGYVLSTPIQLASMAAILANGQKQIKPHLVQRISVNDTNTLNYDKKHIDIVLKGMYDVVNAYGGTAYKSNLLEEGIEFSGKTGSSQVFRITEKLRKEGKTVSDEYLKKEHAVFVGFAPSKNPKIALCVLVEHGGGGASTAAPIAKDIFLVAQKLGYLK